MRIFNESEKRIIQALVSVEPSGTTLLNKVLSDFFFTEEQGCALIIQSFDRYALFYLKPALFDDENIKKEQVAKFIELLSLISYLKDKRYISVYAGQTIKENPIGFISNWFVNPRAGTDKIILNDRGDYTSSPEAIMNKTGKIIYKGVRFDSDIYDMISSNVQGVLFVFPELRDFVDNSSIIKKKNKILSQKHLFVGIGLLIMLFLCSFTGHLMIQLKQQKKTIDNVIKSVDEMHAKLNSMYHRKETSDSAEKVKNNPDNDSLAPDPPGNLYGIDISKYNGNLVDEIGVSDSISFMICKATEGSTYIDPDFRSNWKLIQGMGALKGAYHFYHTNDDPLKQAENFWYALKSIDPFDIAPIVDIEQSSTSFDKAINVIKLQNDLLKFLGYLEQKSNRIPIIYTGTDFANQYLASDNFAKYPLWLAEYGKKNRPEIPKAWEKVGYKIWQKSDSYNFKSEKVDFDVYYGKKSDLRR